MTYERELRAALEAAEQASRLIMEHYAAFKVIPDAPADISTDTDKQSQALILSYLHETFPGDALCAEETIAGFESVPKRGPRLWVVDPIDGTRGFARKTGEFSVMIGFVENGRAVVGVVSEPALSRVTYASAGNGCWQKDGTNATPKHCLVNKTDKLASATVTQSHSRKSTPPSKEIRALNPARVIETYSAGIKLAQVARGDADIYLNTYDGCHDWDVCAGQVLLEEAGGRVSNFRGESFTYGTESTLKTGGLLGSNGVLHEAALEALRVARALSS
jgi:3'(2'), 5'-bisphosphate nucleotidase